MRSTPDRRDPTTSTPLRRTTAVVGAGLVLTEVAGAYLLLRTVDVPDVVAYAATAAVAVVVGGSALSVAARAVRESDEASDTRDESGLARLTAVIVSVTVLTGVTVLLGSVGGLLLTLVARLGGPDPETADGSLLRHRLLDWAERNREFVRNDGRGELPLTP